MPKSHKPITRKTERLALNPGSQFHVDKQFVAPYGWPIADRHIQEFTTDSDGDLGPVDHAGINKNEAHTRMMEVDFIAPHEKRVMGEGWDVHEATSFQEQKLQLAAEREYARIWSDNQKELGWLDNHFEKHAPTIPDSELSLKQLTEKLAWIDDYFTPEFEEMEFSDDELLSTGNQLSPIFSSTGRVIAESTQKGNSPMGMIRSDEHVAFVNYLGTLVRKPNAPKPLTITIPAYVPHSEWLMYVDRKLAGLPCSGKQIIVSFNDAIVYMLVAS